ncbi:MAG: hypothetical protein AB8B57_03120 [Congregibacter sp.]
MSLAEGQCPHQLCFQMLSHRIDIRFQDPALISWLDYLSVSADQPFQTAGTLKYRVLGQQPWAIYEEGDLLEYAHSDEDVLYLIYRRVYQRIAEPFIRAGWVMLHAGLVSVNGQRMILMGDKGAGKTTLVNRLMLAGHTIEGDESILARDRFVTAVPRQLHLKPGSYALLPELADMIQSLPYCHGEGGVVRALDPKKAGFKWQIQQGPVQAILWLSANHNGQTELRRIGSMETLKFLMDSQFDMGESRQQAMDTLPALSTRGGFELKVGCPQSCQRLLEDLSKSLERGA